MRSDRNTKAVCALLLGLTVGLFLALPLHAEQVYLAGSPLPHDYIVRDNRIFIPLNDIAGRLGLSVIFDGERLLIGGTSHGTLAVDPSGHAVDISQRSIDYEAPVFQQDGVWFVPDKFLSLVLDVEMRLEPSSGDVELYSTVFEISRSEKTVRITSSLAPDFVTFELDDPPRRVIDIDEALFPCRYIEIPGSELAIGGIASLRASQFTYEPPVVRVVIEWDCDTAPAHTLSQENRAIEVLVGTRPTGASALFGGNLLPQPADTPAQSVAPSDPVPVTSASAPYSSPASRAAPGSAPATPAESPIEPTAPESLMGPEVPPPGEPGTPEEWSAPTIEDFPEGAENLPLAELGWNVSFEMDAEGELTAVLTTPEYQQMNEFTLTGNGMRLVLDLLGTFLPGPERRVEGLGEVEAVRFGQFQPSVTRIVFDVRKVVAYEIEEHPDEHQIIVRLLSGDLSGKLIAIDPGHGGEDPGAVVRGLMEKDLNLEMAYFLKEFLEEHGARTLLTRENDVYVTLADRIAIARDHDADLFVCIHNNATEQPTAIQGSMALYANNAYMPMYRLVHRGIAARTGVPGIGPVPDERGLYILRHAGDMPVVFVEAAFMTNPIDFARLTDQSRAYASNIMAGVMDGLLAYYAGRDLPPVAWPEYGSAIETGIFDLAGRPIILPDTGAVPCPVDSGSAWDTCAEAAGASEPDSGDSADAASSESSVSADTESSENQDDEADDEAGDDGRHRVRGRGAYRYR